MLRTSIAGPAAALLLTAGLVTATPTTASAVDYKPWGSTTARDQTLRQGCHSYTYRYRVRAPGKPWLAEIFLMTPGGKGLASATLISGNDPVRAQRRFRFCKPSTSAGRHKIRMKVTWHDGRDQHDGWVKPSYFRLTRG